VGFFIGAGVVVAFVLLLAAAAWGDVRAYRIPNVLVAAFPLLFVLAFAGGLVPRPEILNHLGAGMLALLLGMALFYRNWVGGGDAKLFAALALWAGWPEVVRLVTVMALAGGVVSVLVLLRNRGTGRVSGIGSDSEGSLRRKVPYGVAIALAGLDFWIRKLAAPFFFS
jgi:prepilin peptidase CpaA